MGKGLVDLRSPQGFAAETTSAAAILASAHMGFGLSTTQVCSGSVTGPHSLLRALVGCSL